MLDLVRSLVVEFRDVLILLLGAGIGFFLTRIDRLVDSRKRRRVLATAALGDLRWLDHILRQMAEQGATVYDALKHPALTVLLANVDLLKLSAVEKLMDFHALLRDVRAANDYMARISTHLTEEKATRRLEELKAKSGYAVRAIPELVAVLMDAGGAKLGPLRGESVLPGQFFAMPDPPFGTPEFLEAPTEESDGSFDVDA